MNLTHYLYAVPSFWSGVARTFDLFGTTDEYNQSESPAEANAAALDSDWAMVNDAILKAAQQFAADLEEGKLPVQGRLLEPS